MNISQTIWGVNNPTTLNKLKVVAIFIFVALAAFGWYSDFVPSKEWLLIGSTVSAIISAALTILVWYMHWTGKYVLNYRDITSRPTKILITYIAIPIMFFTFIWLSIVHGLTSGINTIIGKPKEETTVLVKNYTRSTRSCEYHLEGEYLNKAVPSYICIKQERFEKLPKNVSVKLLGKETYFGFLVQSVYE